MRPSCWPLLSGLVLLVLCTPQAGCHALQPAMFPAELADATRQVSTSMADQAVWDEVLSRLSGQAIEPGLETYAGVLYLAGGKIRGFSGQFLLEGDAGGSGTLSPEARQAILALSERPDLLAQLIAAAEDEPGPDPDPRPITAAFKKLMKISIL